MASVLPRPLIALAYEEAAQAYLRSLPPEHFMEATTQATQRKITLESLDLLHARRGDVHVFNELLVQYPLPRQRKPGQVVPDNMVVVSDKPIKAKTSFNLPLEPAPPFWVLEYVSRSNKRKDYDDNFDKYEQQLKVPYFLLFHPEDQELMLFHYKHKIKKYAAVRPNKNDRYSIPELDLEIGLRQGWVRFWYRGELLPLPADLQSDLDEARCQAAQANERAAMEARRADEEARRADEEARRAAIEARRADEEARRAEDQGRRADDEARRADDEARRADELERGLEQARRELAELRGQPSRRNGPKGES